MAAPGHPTAAAEGTSPDSSAQIHSSFPRAAPQQPRLPRAGAATATPAHNDPTMAAPPHPPPHPQRARTGRGAFLLAVPRPTLLSHWGRVGRRWGRSPSGSSWAESAGELVLSDGVGARVCRSQWEGSGAHAAPGAGKQLRPVGEPR